MCRMHTWPHRLAVRTSDSHSGDTGSIPVGAAKFHKRVAFMGFVYVPGNWTRRVRGVSW